MAADGVSIEAVVMADIAVVLLAAAVMVRLTRRLHQPPVVIEIVTGIALGPSVLGLLPGDLPARIFPDDARPILSGIAQLGLLLFMFLAGWELELDRLRGRGRTVATVAGLSMAVPFAMGAGAAALLFERHGGDVRPGTFVLYLSTAFSITAFPVLARILSDTALSRTRAGTMAMACAAVGDVAAWCVLVLVVAVSEAEGPGHFFAVLALTLLYALVMAGVVRPLLRRLIRRAARRPPGAAVLALVTSGVFLSAWVTSWIGVHMIFGAFAFGLAMPRDVPPDLRTHAVVPLGRLAALLLPAFFIITGLSVDVGALDGDGLLVLLFLLVVAVAGKLLGAGLPARLSGMSWREAGTFGVLMNTRGLTEIVVLDIGRRLGVIDAEMFTMMVILAVVTTAMAGPLLRLLGVVPPSSGAPPPGSAPPGSPSSVPTESVPSAESPGVPGPRDAGAPAGTGRGGRPLPERLP